MSQVSYGTITINDLTDITDVYLEYALVSDTITRAEDIPSSTQWSTTYPTWVSGQQIWIRRVTRKEGIDTPEYGTPYLDTAVNQVQNNYIGLSNKLRTFFYPGDSTYSGAFAVSKTSTDGLDTANANTYGFNTRVTSALISMGYNKIPLLEMGLLGNNFNGIKLYSPVLTNNVITGNRLDATLTSEGLKLLKGGIEAGTFNSNDYIYVWSNDDNNHAIKIGNSSNNKNDWRIIAGNKFGVDKAGNLYANNADITGAITATSLTIGSGANSYDGAAAINISGYSIEIELSNTGVSDTTSQVYLRPHLYHNGIEDTTNVVYTRYIWYRNDESIGTVGSSVDGGILAYRNSVYRVNYQFDDGEVGSGTPVQTIEVNPTKYITDINNSGIKVHAQDWDDDSNYLQIDGNGVYIKDSNNENLGIYSYYTQIGRSDEAHIEIKNGNITLCNEYSVPIIQMLPGSGNLKTCYESGEGQWANRGGSSSVTYRTVRIQLPTIDLSIDNLVIVFNYTIDSSQTVNFTFSNYGTQTVSGVTAIYSNNEVIINVPTSEEGRYWYRCSYKVYSGIPKFIMGTVSTEVADWSFIVGDNVEATGSHSFAIGQGLKTTGINSIALGTSAHAIGDYSFAKGGFANYISTDDSPYAVARGMCSHAEGSYVEANGNCSYAFGVYAKASKTGSIAIGKQVYAYEENSIAIGKGIETNKINQIAVGTYNVKNNTNDIFIIGKGTSSNRSDALTVDSSGNVTIAGTLTQSSDKRLKEHKSYLSTDAIKFIQNLKPAHFIKDNQSHVGFYAQDVEKIDEWNCMIGEMNGYKTLGYTEIIAPLVAYCQHLEERVKQLENQ